VESIGGQGFQRPARPEWPTMRDSGAYRDDEVIWLVSQRKGLESRLLVVYWGVLFPFAARCVMMVCEDLCTHLRPFGRLVGGEKNGRAF
jgi:hypothetical protein